MRIYGVVALLVLVIVAAVLAYRATTGWSWFDSFYTTVLVLSTNGYDGEHGALNHGAKVLSLLLILVGGGVFVYSITAITSTLMDKETRRYFWWRSRLRKVNRMEKHMIICGLGRVGRSISQELAASKRQFVIVEQQQERLELAAANDWPTMPGDATEDRSLEMAGIARARGLVACVGSDAANLFIVVSARGLSQDLEIYARVAEEANIAKFKKAGANHVYSPYSLLGRTIARNMFQPRLQQVMDLAQEHGFADLTMEERTVPSDSPAVGKTVAEVDFRGRWDTVIFGLVGEGQKLLRNPRAETVINAGDLLILLGPPERLKRMTEELSLST